MLRIALRGDDKGAAAAHAAQPVHPHQPRHALLAKCLALVAQLGTHARHAVGGIGVGMDCANALDEHRIGARAWARRAITPRVVAAGRDVQYSAHCVHRKVGLGFTKDIRAEKMARAYAHVYDHYFGAGQSAYQ